MLINEMNAAISSLKGINRQRTTDAYFDQRDLDNELAEAMRIIIGIRRDIEKVMLER